MTAVTGKGTPEWPSERKPGVRPQGKPTQRIHRDTTGEKEGIQRIVGFIEKGENLSEMDKELIVKKVRQDMFYVRDASNPLKSQIDKVMDRILFQKEVKDSSIKNPHLREALGLPTLKQGLKGKEAETKATKASIPTNRPSSVTQPSVVSTLVQQAAQRPVAPQTAESERKVQEAESKAVAATKKHKFVSFAETASAREAPVSAEEDEKEETFDVMFTNFKRELEKLGDTLGYGTETVIEQIPEQQIQSVRSLFNKLSTQSGNRDFVQQCVDVFEDEDIEKITGMTIEAYEDLRYETLMNVYAGPETHEDEPYSLLADNIDIPNLERLKELGDERQNKTNFENLVLNTVDLFLNPE